MRFVRLRLPFRQLQLRLLLKERLLSGTAALG